MNVPKTYVNYLNLCMFNYLNQMSCEKQRKKNEFDPSDKNLIT